MSRDLKRHKRALCRLEWATYRVLAFNRSKSRLQKHLVGVGD